MPPRSSATRLPGYEDFLAAYPGDPLARRVRAIVAARREAITWRRTYRADTPAGLLVVSAALSAAGPMPMTPAGAWPF